MQQFGFPTNDIVKALVYEESQQKLEKTMKAHGLWLGTLGRYTVPLPFGLSDKRKPLCALSDEELLFRAFLTVVTFSSYGQAIKNHFITKKGGELDLGSFDLLTYKIAEVDLLIEAITKRVNTHYKEKGDISTPLDISNEIAANQINFRTSVLELSMMVAFGGIQQIDITGYLASKTNKCIEVDVKMTLKDWFGVDEEDVYKGGLPTFVDREGLACLWVLQHQRGYKPFINKIKCEFPIKIPILT